MASCLAGGACRAGKIQYNESSMLTKHNITWPREGQAMPEEHVAPLTQATLEVLQFFLILVM